MRRLLRFIVFGAVAAAAACAPKTVPIPTISSPAFPEFLQPTVPPELADGRAAVNLQRAWLFLQANDLRNAEREVAAALKASPGFYPADATAAYIELAEKNARAAVNRFDRVLERQQTYVPALVGKGQALSALDRDSEAVRAF